MTEEEKRPGIIERLSERSPYALIALGWGVFLIGHSGLIALRGLLMQIESPSVPVIVLTFLIPPLIIIVIVLSALVLIWGHFKVMGKDPVGKGLIVLLVCGELVLGAWLFLMLSFIVHIGVGGPL